ncbi:MAG: hypothetical protein V1869_00065 [Candidatus Omnitrophota bacterium]
MLRKGQSTLEYVYLLAIVAAAIIAMTVYIKRGFQGNLRSQADQLGAGGYSPGNTSASSRENKGLESEINSSSVSTITYGNSHRYSSAILALKAQTKALQDEINVLAVKMHNSVEHSSVWEGLNTALGIQKDLLNEKQKELNIAIREWQLEEKTTDRTTSSSSNTETGAQQLDRQASESLGVTSNDGWSG